MPVVLLGFVASALLVAVSAVSSPEWPHKDSAWKPISGPRAAVALSLFGVLIGIPAGLGLVDGSLLIGPGAMMAIFVSRVPFVDRTNVIEPRAFLSRVAMRSEAWFVIFFWSLLALFARLETTELHTAIAAQATLGAALLMKPLVGAIGAGLALVTGLVAAVMWTERLPGRSASTVLRWAESAVAPVLVGGAAVGPAVAVMGRGPLGTAALLSTAISMIAIAFLVAVVSFVRRYANSIPAESLLIGSASLSLLAILMCYSAAR